MQLLNGPLAILVDAATFVVSAATIGALRAPEPPPPPVEDRRSAHIEIRDGIRQIVRDPVLRALAASDLLFQMSFRIFGAVFFLMTPFINTATRVTEREADAFGINCSREPDGMAKVEME